MTVWEPCAGRQFLGRDHGGGEVWSRAGKHLLVCGPSQTGKTSSLFAHAVALATGPTVAVTTKADLLAQPTPQGRQDYLLDLGGRGDGVGKDLGRYQFSPLSLVRSFEDALLTGRTLMDTAYSMTKSGTSNEAYWTQRGARVTSALLWAANRAGLPISHAFHWAASQDATDPLSRLNVVDENDQVAHAILTGLTVPDGRGGSKPSAQANAVWSFAEQALALYAYPVAARLADQPNLDPGLFILEPTQTLHIICPSERAAEFGPAIAVLVQAIVDAQYRAHNRALSHSPAGEGSRNEPPRLTLILDEVANTAALPGLPGICSEGAGQGVTVLIGAQDRTQLEDRFGEQRAHSIVNNCRDRLITTELGDRAFLDHIEALSGRRPLPEEATATRSETGQGTEIGHTTSWGPLWRTHEIAQLGAHLADSYQALYLRGWRPELVDLVRFNPEEPGRNPCRVRA